MTTKLSPTCKVKNFDLAYTRYFKQSLEIRSFAAIKSWPRCFLEPSYNYWATNRLCFCRNVFYNINTTFMKTENLLDYFFETCSPLIPSTFFCIIKSTNLEFFLKEKLHQAFNFCNTSLIYLLLYLVITFFSFEFPFL